MFSVIMTKEQHIDYWVDTAQYDRAGVEEAFNAKRYVHCLFWAHHTQEVYQRIYI
jgi:hypothetical protein